MAILKKVWKCDMCEDLSEKEIPRYVLTRKVEADKGSTTYTAHLCDGCASKSVVTVLDHLMVASALPLPAPPMSPKARAEEELRAKGSAVTMKAPCSMCSYADPTKDMCKSIKSQKKAQKLGRCYSLCVLASNSICSGCGNLVKPTLDDTLSRASCLKYLTIYEASIRGTCKHRVDAKPELSQRVTDAKADIANNAKRKVTGCCHVAGDALGAV